MQLSEVETQSTFSDAVRTGFALHSRPSAFSRRAQGVDHGSPETRADHWCRTSDRPAQLLGSTAANEIIVEPPLIKLLEEQLARFRSAVAAPPMEIGSHDGRRIARRSGRLARIARLTDVLEKLTGMDPVRFENTHS